MNKMNSDINVEGVVLPNSPLSNVQLINTAKKMNFQNFRGVFLRDELPTKTKMHESGIINLDGSGGNGTHWCAWYKTNIGKFYFDSYGLAPPNELVRYLRSPVYYNSERIQPDNEMFCGHLCLYVLKKLHDGYGFQEVINTLQ